MSFYLDYHNEGVGIGEPKMVKRRQAGFNVDGHGRREEDSRKRSPRQVHGPFGPHGPLSSGVSSGGITSRGRGNGELHPIKTPCQM